MFKKKNNKAPVKTKKNSQFPITPKKSVFKTKTFIGVFCIIISAFVAFFALPITAQITSNEVILLAAAVDIEKGTLISSEHFQTVSAVSSSFLPNNKLLSTDNIIGQYAQMDISKDDILTSQKIKPVTPYYDSYLYDLPNNKYAISITMKSFATGLSDKLRPGDIVSIFALLQETSGAGSIGSELRPELRYVKVLAVTVPKGIDVDLGEKKNADYDENIIPNGGYTLTLLIDEQQAALLAGYEASQGVHIVLVCRKTDARAAQFLESQDAVNKSLIEFDASINTSPPDNTPSATEAEKDNKTNTSNNSEEGSSTDEKPL